MRKGCVIVSYRPQVDYLSIDFDSYDLWTFRAVVVESSGAWRPRVVSVEYNPGYPVDSALTLRFPDRDGLWPNVDAVFGTSLGALNLVAQEGGYTLVYAVPGLDAFFVRSDILSAHGLAADIAPLWWHRYPNRLTDGPCLNQSSERIPAASRKSLGGRSVTSFLGFYCRRLPQQIERVGQLEDYAVFQATGSHHCARRAARRSAHARYLLNGSTSSGRVHDDEPGVRRGGWRGWG